MKIYLYAYYDPFVNTKQDFDTMSSLANDLNDQAVIEDGYTLDAYLTHFSGLNRALKTGVCDYCVFFTLNSDIVSFIESWPYTSHIIVLDDLSVCPSLFSGWEQFPSTEDSQEWRPADWERTETTVLVTTRTRLLENVIAFLKREGLSFREGN